MSISITASGAEALIAANAIVMYQHQAGIVKHAMFHDIRLDKDGNPALEVGVALEDATLLKMLEQLTGASPLAFIPANVLASTRTVTVWWCPPAIRTLFIKPVETLNHEYDKLTTHKWSVPIPGLIFARHGCSLSVMAVCGRERPTPQTVLYRAPFANTYDAANICMGNVKVGQSTEVIERQFFDSVFTHDVGSVQRVKGFKQSWMAWAQLATGKKKRTFPEEWLFSTHTTLQGYLKRGAKL